MVTLWFSNATPGHRSRENCGLKRRMLPSIQSSRVYSGKDVEAAQLSSNRGVAIEDGAHSPME